MAWWHRILAVWVIAIGLGGSWGDCWAAGEGSFAHSDSDKRYLHHIDLYDLDNRKISPDSDQPYSTRNTCGRCHDFNAISHGWHFNAFAKDAAGDQEDHWANDGRPGEPWVWTDARTGTQLPLSYRDWPRRFDPASVGLSTHEMTQKFGARLPGGGAGSGSEMEEKSNSALAAEPSRWPLTGDLEIDCMACHAVSGAYDFEKRRETIEAENFAWAPTAALRLGEVKGSVSRMKSDVDLDDEKVQAKLPKVTYDAKRFAADQTVFFDLVRKPENNACYQCHSQRTVSNSEAGIDSAGIDSRWNHDDDVHLRAGMNCVDCHRNGIDHHIVRGFDGEEHPAGLAATTLSCAGCHLGVDADEAAENAGRELVQVAFRAGRLGSPEPLHEGLPPVHFEKLSCTACHAGPIPNAEAVGMMTSLSHALGSSDHRTGDELPFIRGPVYAPLGAAAMEGPNDAGPVVPQRMMWPAYWGKVVDGAVVPLSPDAVHASTRRALRVRKDFMTEVVEKGREEFDEKVGAALEAIEKEFEVEQAVYVSTGIVFARGDELGQLKEITVTNTDAIERVSWPIAHNVRPAGWSLGSTGCLECHADDGLIFASTVTPMGPAPVAATAVSMASLQGIDEPTRLQWNQLFGGRKMFKFLTAFSLVALVGVLFASGRRRA